MNTMSEVGVLFSARRHMFSHSICLKMRLTRTYQAVLATTRYNGDLSMFLVIATSIY